MITIETVEQFETAKNSKNTVLMFSAFWCGDCLALMPQMPEIEAAFPELQFYYVDRDQFLDQCIALDVMGIPSFIVFNDGKEIDRFVSRFYKSKEEVTEFLRAAKEKM